MFTCMDIILHSQLNKHWWTKYVTLKHTVSVYKKVIITIPINASDEEPNLHNQSTDTNYRHKLLINNKSIKVVFIINNSYCWHGSSSGHTAQIIKYKLPKVSLSEYYYLELPSDWLNINWTVCLVTVFVAAAAILERANVIDGL